MKVGGLTWWRNNYGSILQAYALQGYLLENYQIEYEIINQYTKKVVSLENLVLKFRTLGIKATLIRIRGRFGLRKLRKRVEKVQDFIDANLLISEYVYSEKTLRLANRCYDAFICGSDQIWNPANVDLTSMYWLGFVEAGKKKIAYAPSIGIDTISEDQKRIIKESITTFDSLSCREETGTKLLNSILEEEKCVTVLDPTLIVDSQFWSRFVDKRMVEENYVFAYILRGTKIERKLVEKISKHLKMPVVTMPFLDGDRMVMYDFKFGNIKCWDASPGEFINLICHADYVFTDSFHCMIFSCIYHRKFFVFPKIGQAQMKRLTDLMKRLGTGNRIISGEDMIENVLKMPPIPWETVDERICYYRQISKEYLDKAISSINDQSNI